MLLQMSRTHGGMCSFCGSLAPKCRSDMIRLVWGKVLSISGAFSGETGNTWGRELCSRGPGLQVWRFWSTLEAPDRLSSFNFRQRWEIWVDVIINVWRQFDVARKTVYVFFFFRSNVQQMSVRFLTTVRNARSCVMMSVWPSGGISERKKILTLVFSWSPMTS